MMDFKELDETTRKYMLEEFEKEEAGNPYRSVAMTEEGKAAFSDLMREAILEGNEETLAKRLMDSAYWLPYTYYVTKTGKEAQRRVNYIHKSHELALTEFNLWYVRGLAKRLMDEGETHCLVYRADTGFTMRGECEQHDGQTYELQAIYDGHRIGYWPPPGNPHAFSIPVGPNCHHSIRRVRNE